MVNAERMMINFIVYVSSREVTDRIQEIKMVSASITLITTKDFSINGIPHESQMGIRCYTDGRPGIVLYSEQTGTKLYNRLGEYYNGI